MRTRSQKVVNVVLQEEKHVVLHKDAIQEEKHVVLHKDVLHKDALHKDALHKDALHKDAPPTFEVNIDFDEASNAWKNNKKYEGNGTFTYICTQILKTGPNKGNQCSKQCDYELCKSHYRQKYRTI